MTALTNEAFFYAHCMVAKARQQEAEYALAVAKKSGASDAILAMLMVQVKMTMTESQEWHKVAKIYGPEP
jgi:hypothetical protein